MTERITTQQQLRDLARRLGVRADWHEPDEQGVSAEVHGNHLDNAGTWGEPYMVGNLEPVPGEFWVTILHEGKPVAEVNLASLLAMASETWPYLIPPRRVPLNAPVTRKA